MVTLSDPILKRLVEVNPAPDDLELPPVSDVAQFESILGRTRSEESPLRPVRVRSWRPGLVVAAAAFVAVLAVAGALGLLSGFFADRESPVVTEPPVIEKPAGRHDMSIVVEGDWQSDSFTALGPAAKSGLMCGEGTATRVGMPNEQGGETEDTLTCSDGSGQITLSVVFDRTFSAASGRIGRLGTWTVIHGTGEYASITGTGRVNVEEMAEEHSTIYAGYLKTSE